MPGPREVLRRRARETPDRRAVVFLDEHGAEADTLTYGELAARARATARRLAAHAAPGDRALLLFTPGLDFLVAFFGCLEAGVIAVPVAPPRRGHVQEATRSIVADAAPALVLADPVTTAAAHGVLAPALPWLVVGGVVGDVVGDHGGGSEDPVDETSADPASPAFLQYTSGSTSAPKGVVVTHGNLAANEEMIRRAFGHDGTSTFVGWAPLFHDQGLIGNVLQPLHLGALAVLMAPATFIRRPLAWPEAVSRYRARTSGGPDFAFAACVAAARHAGLPEGLDLSCWTVAFDGAEPLHPSTLRDFATTFAPAGFDPAALYPCYGLAEATLLVTGSRPGRGPRFLDVDPQALTRGRLEPGTRTLVGSGEVLAGEEIRIVDPDSGHVCSEGEVGEIRVAGPHVTAGYWRNPSATTATFGGGSLATGDLGALVDGELYVVGRRSDVIVVRGRNHHPGDLEATVLAAHPALAPSGPATTAAFGLTDQGLGERGDGTGWQGGGERVVVVQEVRDPAADEVEVAGAVRAAVLREHDLALAAVVLTRPGALPRTSSGKIRRRAAREIHLTTGYPTSTPQETR